MKKRLISFLLALFIVSLLAGGVPALAAGPQLPCVTDSAELLTETQLQRLEQSAQTITDKYGVGVYIVTVENYRELDPSGVYEATYGVYHEYSMGEGEQRNGLMLLLSMRERDYALFCYGEKAEYAFDAYGMERLEKVFLDDFANDDWNGGFGDYLRECSDYLERAAAGKPVRKSPVTMILIFSGISLLAAFVVCSVLKGQMKTVRKKTTAAAYGGGLRLTEQYDRFTHRTETRRRIERSSSSGSRSNSGGGGSGRSGKF